MGHSLLSPSSAHRWMVCAAAPIIESEMEESRDSQHAALGTAKHSLSEQCLRSGREAVEWLGTEIEADGFKFTIDAEFVRHVDYYVSAVRREKGLKRYEITLDTSELLQMEGQSGTSDTAILNVEDECLTVVDAKFGFHEVRAQDNPQGLIYIGAAWRRYSLVADWKTFRFIIVQPPRDHIDVATYTLAQLLDFQEKARAAAARVQEARKVQTTEELRRFMVPSAHGCQFCKVRGSCPARTDRVVALFPALPPELPTVPALTEAELAKYLPLTAEIESWCKDLHAEARTRALAGKLIPGYKLIDGKRGARYFPDPKAAEARLRELLPPEEVFEEPKLISPTSAEEKLKARKIKYDTIKDFVDQPTGERKLVPHTAPGKPIVIAQAQFAPLTGAEGLV